MNRKSYREFFLLAFLMSTFFNSYSQIRTHVLLKKDSNQINIDGRDDELAWNNAIYTDDFIDIEGSKTPSQKTNVKMLWDDKFLYIFLKT